MCGLVHACHGGATLARLAVDDLPYLVVRGWLLRPLLGNRRSTGARFHARRQLAGIALAVLDVRPGVVLERIPPGTAHGSHAAARSDMTMRLLWKVLLLIGYGAAQAAPPLPQLEATTEMLTVSGISSGAYMAVQFQVTHSSLVRGAGVVAGGPFACAQGQVNRALVNCMAPTSGTPQPDVKTQQQSIATLAAEGKIDNPDHLRAHRVWMFSGGSDKTVQRPVMDALAGFYQSSMPESSIRYVRHPEAGHAMPTVDAGDANDCASSEPPFINRCQNLDAAGDMLGHLLGSLNGKGAKADGRLVRFDQHPFVAGNPRDASLADEGFAYVPKACDAGGCRIHVAFHGCLQNSATVGTRFVEEAGYNRWADSNRLIILYPQTRSRHGPAMGSWKFILNPKGCWDWWGYTGDNYATREGVQIRAVKAMIEQLTKPLPMS